MGATTGITWTDSTQNFWWGCSRVSPGCEHCYAEEWAGRFGTEWGVNAQRRQFGNAHWNQPFVWDKAAAKAGRRHRVFCSSMSDVFDLKAPAGARERMWPIVKATTNLDWQVLTKRPQNVRAMLPSDWGAGYPNVWLGVTVENQEYADKRLTVLRDLPALTKFASYEPALEHVDVTAYTDWLSWLIIGGESGRSARPFDPAWASSMIAQCRAAGVAVFMKQMGEPWARANRAKQRHGADPAEWPAEFRVQEFPRSVGGTVVTRPAPRQTSLAIIQ